MNAVEKIIHKFGGVSELSKLLGHKNVTTVSSWKARGRIPSKWNNTLQDIADQNGIELLFEDFFNDPEPLSISIVNDSDTVSDI